MENHVVLKVVFLVDLILWNMLKDGNRLVEFILLFTDLKDLLYLERVFRVGWSVG